MKKRFCQPESNRERYNAGNDVQTRMDFMEMLRDPYDGYEDTILKDISKSCLFF